MPEQLSATTLASQVKSIPTLPADQARARRMAAQETQSE